MANVSATSNTYSPKFGNVTIQFLNSLSSFLNSKSFSTSLDGGKDAILDTFSRNKSLRDQFTKNYNSEVSFAKSVGGEIEPNNANYSALGETVMSNRGKFPPQAFTIHVELESGASITSEIPADTTKHMKMNIGTVGSGVSNSINLQASSKVVETLILDKGGSALLLLQKDVATPTALASRFSDY